MKYASPNSGVNWFYFDFWLANWYKWDANMKWHMADRLVTCPSALPQNRRFCTITRRTHDQWQTGLDCPTLTLYEINPLGGVQFYTTHWQHCQAILSKEFLDLQPECASNNLDVLHLVQYTATEDHITVLTVWSLNQCEYEHDASVQ